jgi:DNA primase
MANLIPDSFIETLLAKVDIVDLIGARVPLQKKGKNYLAKCPFHAEKTPSFSVDQSKQFYHCFGCGASGDAISFLREIDRLSFIEAVEILASQLSMQIPKEYNNEGTKKQAIDEIYAVLEVAAEFFKMQLKNHPAASHVIAYLKSRGLDGNTAKRFNVGYAPPGWESLKQHVLKNTSYTIKHMEQAGLVVAKENSAYDRFRNRVMFPIKDRRGKIVGFGGRVITTTEEPKYLNSPESIVFSKGKELYGLYEARQFSDKLTSLLVVEGYMDVLALAQAGVNNVVAILGTALTSENIKLLFRIVPEIIFCFDADNAGRKAAWKALEVCLPNIGSNSKVSFLFLPEAEDPDSYVRKYGKNKFLEQIKRAEALADFFFRHLTNQMDLESTEDRATIVVRARELLQQIPDEVFKHIMFDRLANLTGLDRTFLKMGNTKKQYDPKITSKYESKHGWNKNIQTTQLPKSPAVIALALLLVYPELIDLLESTDIDQYSEVELSGVKIFFAVAKILKANPRASFIEISSLLPSSMAKRFVPEELRGIALFVPKSGIKQEFSGIITKIKVLYDEQKLEVLLSKAKTEGLSAIEKVQLQQLLLKKNADYIAE